jgi:uncharacterized RDD family membrane protein YckC
MNEKCSNHPDLEATNICNQCGNSYCSQCLDQFEQSSYCRKIRCQFELRIQIFRQSNLLERTGASLIDGIIVSLFTSLLLTILTINFLSSYALVFGILYYSVFEAGSKQATFGKQFVGFKVTDLEGRRISFFRALIRNITKILSFGLLLIGILIIPFTKRHQALHDIICKTLVVSK